jgi:hypothetical protein
MTHDRSDGDQLTMTQEFLSMMLGLRRATVTDTLTELRRANVLGDGGRARIMILDRSALESMACECYGKMKAWLNAGRPIDGVSEWS